MNSYDVRFWDIKKVSDTAKGRWRVRWAVAGRPHCKSFPARPLAEGFLASLKDAVRDHLPFDPATGLPVTGPAARRRPATSPGTSTPAPTPTPNGRTWPRSPAGRSPSR